MQPDYKLKKFLAHATTTKALIEARMEILALERKKEEQNYSIQMNL